MNPIVLIPARMAATRLPNKPLADIGGLPMIVRVLNQALKANIGPVAVAAGDIEIVEAVRAAGGLAVLTDPQLPSGSDRIVAALAQLDPHFEHDVVINLQGDMPFVDPSVLGACAGLLEDFGEKVSMPLKAKKAIAKKVIAPTVLPTVAVPVAAKPTQVSAKPAPVPAKPVSAPAVAKPTPVTSALRKKLEAQNKKLVEAKLAGKPTKAIEDRIYEIEDDIRVAQSA